MTFQFATIIVMNIGQKIKELRNEKGITQEQLAAELQISRPALALYETGKRQIPNELILSIAKFFYVTTDYLFGLEN